MFSTLISSHQIIDLTRLHLLSSWSLRQQNYSSVILLPHASESRSSIRFASVIMIDALRCWRFNSMIKKFFLIRSICDRCHTLKSNRVASSMWRHNVIKFFAVTLRVRCMSTSKNIFWCVRSRSLRLMALRLFPQTTHQFTSFLSDQSRQLLLELFLSRKSFSSSGINTPASQPCRPCRWRVAVTPFRSELMGVALRLGLRTLASLVSLRTLVVFLPSKCFSQLQLLTVTRHFRPFRRPSKKGQKKASFWGSQKRPFFDVFYVFNLVITSSNSSS